MAGFDTTDIAGKLNTTPGDPFKVIGNLADLQNSLNQNKMFQAKTRAGQYLEQSIGPDGQPDLGKFSAALQSDSLTAPFAQDALQGVANLRSTGISNVQSTVNLQKSQFDNLRNIAATYGNTSTAKDPKARDLENSRNAASAVAQAVQSGLASPEVAAQFAAQGGLSTAIRAATIGGAGGEGAQEALAGKPTNINTGGKIEAVTPNRWLGTQNSMGGDAASLAVTMTPTEKQARIPGVDPNTGQPYTTPLTAIADDTGGVRPNNGITGPGGKIDTGLAVGAEVPKLGYAEQLKILQDIPAELPQQESRIKELLAYAKGVRTGPGSTQSADVITAINRALGTNFDAKATPGQQILNKLSEQIAATARPSLGLLPTNEQVNMSRASSPNVNISNEAVEELGSIALGNLEWAKAKNDAWNWADKKQFEKTGKHLNPGTDYGVFQNRFNALHDPRYFQQEFWTQQQRDQMLNAMSKSERERYLAAKKFSDRVVSGYSK